MRERTTFTACTVTICIRTSVVYGGGAATGSQELAVAVETRGMPPSPTQRHSTRPRIVTATYAIYERAHAERLRRACAARTADWVPLLFGFICLDGS